MAYNIKEYRRILNDPYHTTSKDWGGWSKWYKDVYSKSQLASLGAAERKAKQQYATFTTQARNQLTQSVQQMKQTVETDALRRGMSRSSMPGSVIGSETERMGEQYQKQDEAARSGLEKTVASVRANRKIIADMVSRTGSISQLFKDNNAIDSETLAALTDEKVDFSVIGEMAKTGANFRDIIQKQKDLQAQQQNRDKMKTEYAAKDYKGYDVIKEKWFKNAYGLDKDDFDINSKADTLGNRLYFSRLGEFQSLVDIAKSNFDDKLNAYLETAKYTPEQALKHLYPETPETVFDLSKEFQKKGIVSSDGKINLNKAGSLYSEYKANYYSKLNYKYNETDPEDKRRKENGEMPLSLEKEYADTPEDQKRKKDGELPLSVENKINVENAYNTRLAELIRKKEAGALSEQDIKDAANDKTIKAYDEWLAQDWDNRRALSQASSRSPEAHEHFKNLKTAPAPYTADTFASMKAHGFTGIGALFNEWWDGIKQAAITKNEEYFTKSLADFKAEYKDVVFKRDPETGKFIPVPIDTKNNSEDQPYVFDYNNPVLNGSANVYNQPAYFWQHAANNPLSQLFDMEDNLAKAISQFKSIPPDWYLPTLQTPHLTTTQKNIIMQQYPPLTVSAEKYRADQIEKSAKEEFNLKPTDDGGYISTFIKPISTDGHTVALMITPKQAGMGVYLTFYYPNGEQANNSEFFISADDAQTAAKSYAEQYKFGGALAIKPLGDELNEQYTNKLYKAGTPRAFISGYDDKHVDSTKPSVPGGAWYVAESEKHREAIKQFKTLSIIAKGDALTSEEQKLYDEYAKIDAADEKEYIEKYKHLRPDMSDIASLHTIDPDHNNVVDVALGTFTNSVFFGIPDAIRGASLDDPYNRIKATRPYAAAFGDIAGMLVPVGTLENITGKIILKAFPKLINPIVKAAIKGGVSFPSYNLVRDVVAGKSAEEVASNFLFNAATGALGDAGLAMIGGVVKGLIPKLGTPLYESWLKSGKLLDVLKPYSAKLAKELEVIAGKSIKISANLMDAPINALTKDALLTKMQRLMKIFQRPLVSMADDVVKLAKYADDVPDFLKLRGENLTSNTGRISGINAKRVAAFADGKGLTLKTGDNIVIRTVGSRIDDVKLLDENIIGDITKTGDGSISRVFKAEKVGAEGKNLIYTDITDDVLKQAYSNADNLKPAAVQAGNTHFTGEYELKPNIEYTTNGYHYATNENGSIIHANGELKLEKGTRDAQHQLEAGGRDRLSTDHGGHLFATRFNGSPLIDNIVAMNGNVNTSAYKKLENEWVAALSNGKRVDVSIDVVYNGSSKRPDAFIIEYSINGRIRRVSLKNKVGG